MHTKNYEKHMMQRLSPQLLSANNTGGPPAAKLLKAGPNHWSTPHT